VNVSRETWPYGWDIHSTGPRGREVRWRRDPAEALALAAIKGGTVVPAGSPSPPLDTCNDCGEPILPDQAAGYDYAGGRCHAGCFLGLAGDPT
jgi:hypothetical protein